MDNLTVFERYLQQREKALRKFHPQWDYTNDEIDQCDDLLKRDSTPICIPPSWDLVQKYAGALDKNADGYDKDLYERGERSFIGDQGEAEFLDLMRNLKIGGILIGNINSEHLLYGALLPNNEKEYYMVPTPNNIMKPLKKVGQFELDFLYFHPYGGLFLIEIKKRNDFRTASIPAANTFAGQMRRHRAKLSGLIKILVNNSGGTEQNVAQIMSDITCLVNVNGVLFFEDGTSTENMLEYFQGQAWSHDSFFREKYFQNIIIFLAGYRPDFFISPVQCALTVYKNIFTHQINTVNFYAKKDKESNVQNLSLTVKDFLQNLKFVQHTDINFGEHSKIYLTTEQMNAIGKFDGEGNFSPRLQLILGPPGSGKSLIMMIKMFICGQMEQRKDRPIIYSSQTGGVGGPPFHQQKLAAFIENNRSAFCREFGCRWMRNIVDINKPNDDYFVDEDYTALSMSNSGGLLIDRGQMITLIYTGIYGDATSPNYLSISTKGLGFECVTQLRTVFRSSRQIQRYFFEHSYLKDSISLDSLSGHNYDGVKVETHDFPNLECGLRFAEKRLMKLVGIEGCRETDIGLYIPYVDREYHQRFTNIKKSKQIKQIEQQIRQRFENINVYDYYGQVSSLEFPVVLIVDEPSHSSDRFLLASRAICYLIVCNVIKAHVERSDPTFEHVKRSGKRCCSCW